VKLYVATMEELRKNQGQDGTQKIYVAKFDGFN
jgi:hypothetical protein